MTPITCSKCGAEIPGGTLLAHVLATHPAGPEPTAKKPYVCRQAKCVDVYGRGGHTLAEGSHAH